MSREKFPPVKPGQRITATRANQEGEVLNRFAGMAPGPGMSGRHSGSVVQFGAQPEEEMGIVTVTDIVTTGADPPIYLGTYRHYDFQTNEWKEQTHKWQIDAKGLNITLAVGDEIVVYWDLQRGMLVPCGGGGSTKLRDFKSQVIYPGRGVLFDVWLGVWSSVTHSYVYDTSTTYKAVDWRCWSDQPDQAGFTGVGYWEPSDVYGRVLVVVDMDCEVCDDMSSESSSSSGSISSQSSESSMSSESSASSGSVSSQSSESSMSDISSASESSKSESSECGSQSSSISSASDSSLSESSASESRSTGSSGSSQFSQSSQSSASESSTSSFLSSSSHRSSSSASDSSLSESSASVSSGGSSGSVETSESSMEWSSASESSGGSSGSVETSESSMEWSMGESESSMGGSESSGGSI